MMSNYSAPRCKLAGFVTNDLVNKHECLHAAFPACAACNCRHGQLKHVRVHINFQCSVATSAMSSMRGAQDSALHSVSCQQSSGSTQNLEDLEKLLAHACGRWEG